VLAKGVSSEVIARFEPAFGREAVLARNLMPDARRAFFGPFIRAVRQPNGREPADHRRAPDSKRQTGFDLPYWGKQGPGLIRLP